MNYQKVSTKKLQTMLENATAEEADNINAVLAERGAIQSEAGQTSSNEKGDQTSSDDNDDLTFLESLEGQAEQPKKGAAKSNKMTFEEAQKLAEELKINVGHICRVVPFNTIAWEQGYIRGVVADKRSCKVLYAIALDNGQKIVKAHDSKFLEIQTEVAEVTKTRKGRTSSAAEKLDDEALAALAAETATYVGNFVEYEPTKELYILVEGEDKPKLIEKLKGVIMAIVPDKRSGRILLRIENELKIYDHATESEKTIRLVTHKVSVSPDVKILDEVDEEVKARYAARLENRLALANMTPEAHLEKAAKLLEKTNADIAKLQELLIARTADFEAAKVAYEEWIAKQAADKNFIAEQIDQNESVEDMS